MYLEMQFHDIKTNVPKWDAAVVTLPSTPVLSFLKKDQMACLYPTGELSCNVIKPLNPYLIKLRVKHNQPVKKIKG